jgi:PPOX class probable F420-dependent enzyme
MLVPGQSASQQRQKSRRGSTTGAVPHDSKPVVKLRPFTCPNVGEGMPTQTPDPALQELLRGRYIATLATENADGTVHLTAVWYLFEDGCLFVATSSKSRKARNIAARPKASLMVDVRKPGAEQGVSAAGNAEVISGAQSEAINRRIHSRYMSPAALSDPAVGPVFASFDDVTLRLTPVSWTSWNMAVLDAQAFGGRLGKMPGYLLPLD